MKTLDIVHPAAKTLVDISLAQDAEVGASFAWYCGCAWSLVGTVSGPP